MTAADPSSSAPEPAAASAPEPALRGLSLVRLAGVHAGLCEGVPIARVLELEGVAVRLWERAEPLWVDKLAEDGEEDGPLQDAYDERLAAARLRYGRSVEPLGDDLRAWADFLRALQGSEDPPAFLATTGVRATDLLRLHASWSERLAEDALLRASAEDAFSAEPGPLPQITFVESPPRPPPAEGPLFEVPLPADADEDDEEDDLEDDEDDEEDEPAARPAEAAAGGEGASDGADDEPPPLWVPLEGWGLAPVQIGLLDEPPPAEGPGETPLARPLPERPSGSPRQGPTPPPRSPPRLETPLAPPRPRSGPPREMPSFVLAQAAKASAPPAPPTPERPPPGDVTEPAQRSPLAGTAAALPFKRKQRPEPPLATSPPTAQEPPGHSVETTQAPQKSPLAGIASALPFERKPRPEPPVSSPPITAQEPPGHSVETTQAPQKSPLAGIAGALPFERKPRPEPPVSSPPPTAPRSPDLKKGMTMMGTISPFAKGPVLPFAAGASRRPEPPNAGPPPPGEVTSGPVASPLKGAVLPFRRDPSPVPPVSPAAPPVPPEASSRLTLDQYAALCAELAVVTGGTETAFLRYGLTSLQERLTVDLAWQDRLRNNPAEREAWTALFRRYHAYFTDQMKRGGPRK